jgi:AcrR family transcriptional regulator
MSITRSPAQARIHDAAVRLFAERGASEVAVSDLAEAAGVARGTIYNNVARPDALFGEVAGALAHEMVQRVEASMRGIEDPAARLATGLRLFVRRAHEEPHWGRFVVRFAASEDLLRTMMDEPPARDMRRALETGRFKIDASRLKAAVALLNGAALSAMHGVIAGHQTWRDGGSHAAELVLRALGVAPAEARRISETPLPPLAKEDSR